jgi:hypothetical protein
MEKSKSEKKMNKWITVGFLTLLTTNVFCQNQIVQDSDLLKEMN